MSGLAIRAENLGKQYRLGRHHRYNALRDLLTEQLGAPWRWLRRERKAHHPGDDGELLWALRAVSFEVRHGEVLGVIGRNGAGKSTLLKILSRITTPTEGSAEVRGRVGSLLEVGTGFHPELTGRENVYLNGAILGMSKVEISRKFEEILAFAEVERFIDMPAKRYSSGMLVRLAFAVAAHLDPEIMLVDEVLAVGDAAFQKKCLGKIDGVAQSGRTVLLVSHNMAVLNRLCFRGLWLDQGTLRAVGPMPTLIDAYLATGGAFQGQRTWEDPASAPGNDKMRLRGVRIVTRDGRLTSALEQQDSFTVEIEYDVLSRLAGARVGFFLLNTEGVVVFAPNDAEDAGCGARVRNRGRYVSSCTVPGALLNKGAYVITPSADIPGIERLFYVEHALRFHVERLTGAYGARPDRLPGVICPPLEWRVSPADEGRAMRSPTLG